jgi:hypothetical protein
MTPSACCACTHTSTPSTMLSAAASSCAYVMRMPAAISCSANCNARSGSDRSRSVTAAAVASGLRNNSAPSHANAWRCCCCPVLCAVLIAEFRYPSESTHSRSVTSLNHLGTCREAGQPLQAGLRAQSWAAMESPRYGCIGLRGAQHD